MFPSVFLLAALGVFAHLDTFTHGCQLPSEWRPLSEGCRAELAEIIVYAKVLAIHREPLGGGAGSLYNSLPYGFGYGYEGAEEGLLYSAEVELLCDQAWGSMLEVPTGSRLNLTGLGYLSCQSHTVMENYSYFFFLRWGTRPGHRFSNKPQEEFEFFHFQTFLATVLEQNLLLPFKDVSTFWDFFFSRTREKFAK